MDALLSGARSMRVAKLVLACPERKLDMVVTNVKTEVFHSSWSNE